MQCRAGRSCGCSFCCSHVCRCAKSAWSTTKVLFRILPVEWAQRWGGIDGANDSIIMLKERKKDVTVERSPATHPWTINVRNKSWCWWFWCKNICTKRFRDRVFLWNRLVLFGSIIMLWLLWLLLFMEGTKRFWPWFGYMWVRHCKRTRTARRIGTWNWESWCSCSRVFLEVLDPSRNLMVSVSNKVWDILREKRTHGVCSLGQYVQVAGGTRRINWGSAVG